jgi:hypothetical protein
MNMMTQTTYACPACHAIIPIEDVNVAADIALCRACGKATPFSLLCGASQISTADLEMPPRGVKVERDFTEGIRIVYRRISPLLLFFIPFTAIWSGGSMWGIYINPLMKGEFNFRESLFGLPFLIGTVVLVGVIAFMMFGKWVVTLRKGEGTVFVGVGSLGWTRHFVYKPDSLVSLQRTNVEVNNVPQKGVAVRTDEQDFVFGSTLKDDVKRFIAAYITKAARAS